MKLVKYEQILSLFNQAYYYMNYCLLSVGKCYYVYISQGDFEREELERNQLKFLLRELRIPGEVHVSNLFIHLVK